MLEAVQEMKEEGYSERDIAKELEITPSKVHRLCKKLDTLKAAKSQNQQRKGRLF